MYQRMFPAEKNWCFMKVFVNPLKTSVILFFAGKSIFRLTYFTDKDSYKHHDFETDDDVANEIVQKIKNILEMRLSPVRKDYMASKERKLKKRESLKFS